MGWNGAEPPVLPPLTPVERLRLGLRGACAGLVLVLCFGLYLVVHATDGLRERIALRPVRRLGPRIVRAWAALSLPLLGLRLVTHGRPMRRRGAYVANHSSWIDIVALQAAAAPYLISKAEVRSWPGIGLIGRAIGTLFIDRAPTASEARRQQAQLAARLARGDHMAIFPEGTSTDGQRLLPFKSPLFAVFFGPHAEPVSVQPVTISYHVRPGQPATLYNWWGDMDFAPHLISLLARSTDGRVELRFHAPILLAGVAGRKSLALAAEAAVRQGFEDARDGA